MQTIHAKNYTPASRPLTSIRLIVIHDMEASQGTTTAEAVGNYFAGPDAPQASAHVGFDEHEGCIYVPAHDIAWGAPNANTYGYQIEHAGYAKNNRGDWLNPDNRMMLERSAEWAAIKATEFGIKLHHMTDDDNIYAAMTGSSEHSGFVGHLDVSRVSAARNLLGDHTHTDPGENWPWGYYIDLVKHYANRK